MFKFLCKNSHIIKPIFTYSKFTFARKVSNNGDNSTSKNKLFSKFSVPEDNLKDTSSDQHFKKVLKKESSYDNVNSVEAKKLNRIIEEKVNKGLTVKQVVKDLMKGENNTNESVPHIENKFGGQFDMESFQKSFDFKNLQNDEIELIKKKRNVENRKSFSIDPKSFDDKMSETPIYNQEDLDKLREIKKLKDKGRVEEKDLKEMKKYKIKGTNERIEEKAQEVAQNFKDKNLNKKEEEDPDFERVKKEFQATFSKKYLKKKKSTMEKEENEGVRDLRKIKNMTSPEYIKTDVEHESNTSAISTDLVDTLPDIDIVAKRERTADVEDSFKNLVARDLHPYDSIIEKKDQVIQEANKLSRMNTLNLVNIRQNRNEIFKKRALDLAKVWQMDARETKQWYYRLKREEKLIFKAILMRKRLEQKRKLKKLAKQWKIENEENIEINYLQMLREEAGDSKANLEPEKLNVPKHYKNVNEFLFFGEDTEFFRHYKRTCKNILNSLSEFFSSNKMGIKRGIGRNIEIAVTEVKMNKSMTVAYVWWDLPVINSPILDQSADDNEAIYKTVELNLNQAVPYIKGVITREVGLKYAPDVRFIRDTLDEETMTFEKEVKELFEEDQKIEIDKSREKRGKILRLLDRKEFILSLKNFIKNVKNEQTRNSLTKMIFGDGSNQTILNYVNEESIAPISTRLSNLIDHNPKLNQSLFQFIKSSLGVDESNVDEYFSRNKELSLREDKITKMQLKQQKQKERIFKKMNIKEEDLKKKKNINISDSINNFLNQYDRKIPGQYTMNPSFKEMKEIKNKKDFVDELVQNKVKSQIKSEIKASEKIGKCRESRRNKAAEFWNKLNNQLL